MCVNIGPYGALRVSRTEAVSFSRENGYLNEIVKGNTMKRMKWGLFLVLALISVFLLIELFSWSWRVWPASIGTGKSLTLQDLVGTFSTFIVSILAVIALAAAIATIYRFHQIGLSPALIVIEPFQQVLPAHLDDDQRRSIELEIREHLIADLKSIGKRVEQIVKERGPDLYQAPFSSPPFSNRVPEFIEQRGGYLQDIAESAPEKVEGLTVPLSKKLFPLPAVKVRCILVERGTSEGKHIPGRLGISYEISHTIGTTMPAIGIVFSDPDEKQDTTSSEAITNCYKAMSPNIGHILAIELCKAQMLAHLHPWWYQLWRTRRWKAQVYNFIGFLFLLWAKEGASKTDASKLRESDFYRGAVENLQLAIRTDENWYIPYINLALMHSTRGQQIENDLEYKTGEEKATLLKRALYLQYAARNEYQQALACVLCPLFVDEGIREARRRIRIDLVRVNLLIGKLLLKYPYDKSASIPNPHDFITWAKNEMDDIQQEFEEKQSAEDEQNLFKINVLTDVQIPYNLACNYAIAYGIDIDFIGVYGGDIDKDYTNAYRYLARSLARNAYILARHKIQEDYKVVMDIEATMDTLSHDFNTAIENPTLNNTHAVEDPNWYYWARVETDLDFKSMNGKQTFMNDGQGTIFKLKEVLMQELMEDPSLYPKSRKGFNDKIDVLTCSILKYSCASEEDHQCCSAASCQMRSDKESIRGKIIQELASISSKDVIRYFMGEGVEDGNDKNMLEKLIGKYGWFVEIEG